MTWQLKIEDPSGELRTAPIHGNQGSVTLGRNQDCTIILKDPTLAEEAMILWPGELRNASPFWLRIPSATPSGKLGDLSVREAHFPLGIPLQIGGTRLTLQENLNGLHPYPTPRLPAGVKPWLTCTEAGRLVLWTAQKAAETSLSIYIGGETGTGKEVMAHLIHAWSHRRKGPFIPLHCGALSASLAESELFGHVKGAFTGASHFRTGALVQAHSGTLFLDEIGDLSLDMQVKLLRFLENGEIRPVGADRSSKADVRLICATHQPLLHLVNTGKFRRDLYYRLASITVEIPSLRSRPDDISLLAKHFAAEFDRIVSPQGILRLQTHSWRGNVRELRHAIERATGFNSAYSPILGEDSFEFLLTAENISDTPEMELGPAVLSLNEMEKVVLIKALRLARGHRSQAAKILGVARSTLFEMMKRHQLLIPRKKTQTSSSPALPPRAHSPVILQVK